MPFFLQEFTSHSEEMDSERVQEIMTGALKDVQWIVEKVHNLCMLLKC